MATFDDIIRRLASLTDGERLAFYDRLARYAALELAALGCESAEVSEIDENQNVCSSCIMGDSYNSILLATPKEDSKHSNIYNILYKDSSVPTIDKSKKKEEKKNSADNNTQDSSLVRTEADMLPVASDPQRIAEATEWIDIYNTICASFPKAAKVTDLRVENVAARRNRFSTEMFTDACRNLEDSEWLKARGFASFDWLTKSDENLLKVAEGNYNRKRSRPSAGGTITGRPALLVKLIDAASQNFDKAVDSIALARALEDAIVKDSYYAQLDKADLQEVFRRGCARQYEYHGLTTATFCGWFNAYKDDWKEKRRKANMTR